MPLLRRAGLVASMPSWTRVVSNKDELDLTPRGEGQFQPPTLDGLLVPRKAVQGSCGSRGHDG